MLYSLYRIFYRLIRRLLFLFPAESSHYLALNYFKLKYHFLKHILRSVFCDNDKRLEKTILGLKFKNPIGLAAGFDKNADYVRELECFGFGFIEIGTVTPLPQYGNSKPRVFRIKSDNALINRLGFNNKGVKHVVSRLRKLKTNIVIGVNIGKNKNQDDFISDYAVCFSELHNYADYFTINVSSPNTPGLRDLQNIKKLEHLLKSLIKINKSFNIQKPIFVKISPDLNDSSIIEIVNLLVSLKIDGIICTNTTISRDGLTASKSKVSKIGNGGLSGKPLLDRSNHIVKLVRENVPNNFIIIGVGGIINSDDAINKINAGADLIQLYTGFIYSGPVLLNDIKLKILNNEY